MLQGDLPSTLLSLVVLNGEVRVVPVRAEDCQGHPREFWEIPIFLTKGDAGYCENLSMYSQFTEKPGGNSGGTMCWYISVTNVMV